MACRLRGRWIEIAILCCLTLFGDIWRHSEAQSVEPPLKWIPFNSDICRLRISFPSIPIRDPPRDDRGMQTVVYTAEGRRAAYSVMCMIYPPGYGPRNGAKANLELLRDTAVKAVNGTLMHDMPMIVQGYPARDLIFRGVLNQVEYIDHQRMIQAGQYVYTMEVTYDSRITLDIPKEVDDFYKTFVIRNK